MYNALSLNWLTGWWIRLPHPLRALPCISLVSLSFIYRTQTLSWQELSSEIKPTGSNQGHFLKNSVTIQYCLLYELHLFAKVQLAWTSSKRPFQKVGVSCSSQKFHCRRLSNGNVHRNEHLRSTFQFPTRRDDRRSNRCESGNSSGGRWNCKRCFLFK